MVIGGVTLVHSAAADLNRVKDDGVTYHRSSGVGQGAWEMGREVEGRGRERGERR